MSYGYDEDNISAFDAITEAQKIAFAPMLFQAALNLRNYGVLAFLSGQGKTGATKEEIVALCKLNSYAVGVLLDMGLSGRIIYCKDARYYLGKIGHFLHDDPMTRVNMDFTQDVCYQGLFYLDQSLQEQQPSGLKNFGDWPTIYHALNQLPENAKRSWFAFDHYYSDAAFNGALPHVFAKAPGTIYDVGGNTGKWAILCCNYSDDVAVTIIDLPQQIALAKQAIGEQNLSHRVDGHAADMLTDAALPTEADVWWMSQFLDCFSEVQIVQILKKISAAMKPHARICIMEIFWDQQAFEAGAFSLNASSLYFTCMANGNSRFYSAENFLVLIKEAGLEVEQHINHIGLGHTLLMCKKAA